MIDLGLHSSLSRSGLLYPEAGLDAFQRKIVGSAMATNLRTELMLAAIDMAIKMRQPRRG